MNSSLQDLREKYGSVFVTTFPDGMSVPWKPLNIGDYIKYDHDIKRGFLTRAQIEDEIFCKSVLDESLVRQAPFIKAGIITTVANNVWQFSGPVGVEEFNFDLDMARGLINNPATKILHELVGLILTAFPIYKPEEVYAMDYETFLIRTAQAENKLMLMKILKQPISLHTTDPVEQQESPKKDFVDAKALWDLQHGTQTKNKHTPSVTEKKPSIAPTPNKTTTREKWWNVSPVLESKNKHNIPMELEKEGIDAFGLDSHERLEDPEVQKWLLDKKLAESRKQTQDDAQWIYKDLIAALEKKKKQ